MQDPRLAGEHVMSRRALLRGAAVVGLAAAAGTLLPDCGSGGGGEGQASGPDADGPLETTSIRLHAVPPAICYAPGYLAERFLREEGFTDVQYPSFTAKNFVHGYVAGEIDFGMGYAASLIPVIEAGAPLVMLSGVHAGCWRIFGTGGIRSMRDFKGKTVSIIGPDYTDGIFMAMTLANVGLDLRKDVKLVSNLPTENARLLSSGEVDAVVAFPPISKDLQAKGIGTVVLNSLTDPPWSNYYCCMAVVNGTWKEKHPVATKRALRAMLRAADVIAKDPNGSARFMVDRGYTNNFNYACDALKEIPYNNWRDFDPQDSVRFYALRLKEAGIIKSTPGQILKRGTDFRYFSQLKRELKEA
jgi:NitT/TauT family transport system substrate-binding protein